MSLEPQLIARLETLLQNGDKFLSYRGYQCDCGSDYWVDEHYIPEIQAWMTSAANLISLTTPPASNFRDVLERITTNDQLLGGVPWVLVQKMQGLLRSIREEATHGLLRRLEDVVVATAFDDFLDHADAFHRGNKAREAGVLAAIVLEDTLKRIAQRHGVQGSGQSLEPLIDELTKAGVFTTVKAKRIKAYAGVRNPALHAEWDKFDIRDAGDLIAGTRDLIANYL